MIRKEASRCSLQKITRYSLQTFLVAKYRSLLVAEVPRCKNDSLLVVKKSLVTRWKIHSLLVAEVARCKNHSLLVAKLAGYSLQKLLVPKNHWFLVAKFLQYSLQKIILR